MDLVASLLRTSQGHDNVWMIVDRLTKKAHFFQSEQLGQLTDLLGCLWTEWYLCTEPRSLLSQIEIRGSLLVSGAAFSGHLALS